MIGNGVDDVLRGNSGLMQPAAERDQFGVDESGRVFDGCFLSRCSQSHHLHTPSITCTRKRRIDTISCTCNLLAMGRKKLWAENINLTLPEGAKARMDAALKDGEDRLDLIRTAIETELERREKPGKRSSTKSDNST